MEMTLQKEVVMEVIGKKRIKSVKPVMCVTEGKTFSSVSDAAEYYGVHVSSISRACCLEHRTCKGMKFCYVDNVKENLHTIAEEINTKRNEMDPVVEKANAYDALMEKKTLIANLRNEIHALGCQQIDISDKLYELEKELVRINDIVNDKEKQIAEMEIEIRNIFGL